MIVRILNEGQYRVPDAHVAHLNEIDARLEAAVDGNDRTAFADDFAALLDLVRSSGEPVGQEELAGSDVLLPPADASFEEVRALLTVDGLVPGR